MENSAIEISGLSKSFGKKKALSNINLTIAPGEFVALIGTSGSGKSTLLRHTSGLLSADKGSGGISVFGQSVQENGRLSARIRDIRANIGFIFQQFNLVDRLTLLQNVCVGMITRVPIWRSLAGIYTKTEKQSAMKSLYRVGLYEQVSQRASTLSGGQQQRAAIARTMEQKAKIILADEPIASLDPESARTVMECLAQLNREDKVTVVVSLHQVQFALEYCPRLVALKDGQIIYDGPSDQLTPAMLKDIYGSRGAECIDGTVPLTDMPKKVRNPLHGTESPGVPVGLAQAGA
jgi:phosphonate transport system ATP-binding protein